jgi:hypothetical protein
VRVHRRQQFPRALIFCDPDLPFDLRLDEEIAVQPSIRFLQSQPKRSRIRWPLRVSSAQTTALVIFRYSSPGHRQLQGIKHSSFRAAATRRCSSFPRNPTGHVFFCVATLDFTGRNFGIACWFLDLLFQRRLIYLAKGR